MRKVPRIIEEVGFNFHWSAKKVWELDVPVEEMDISELEWHLEIPFWNTEEGFYNLKPVDVLNDPDRYREEFNRTLDSDLSYPLDIMFWKNRWLLLDGLHRLLKAKYLDLKKIQVRKISQDDIPLITK